MRIRKRLQSRLPPPDSSFLPSPLLGGASATGVSSLPDRGAREEAQESIAAADDVLEREAGSRIAGLLHFNVEGVLSTLGNECITGEFTDLSSHPHSPASGIDGRDLSAHSLFPYLIEAAKREADEDALSKRLSAGGSSEPKTKRGGSHRLGGRKTAKAEERENQEDDEEEEKPDKAKKTMAVKKRRKPAVLMEGSRCSRVNGRGWRCSQQTLVGYSLCEHHLGKSRLRSVNSVKCNDRMKKEEFLTSEEDSEAEKRKKKTRRIGQVKARSISSLLSQTQISMVTPPPPSSSSPGVVGICMQ